MAITTRAGKGSPLSNSEVDANFLELQKKFDVTANSGNYVFSGSGTSSDNNPTLYLSRGETYYFAVNASGHPFYIKTQNSTGTSNAYSDGVTNNGTASGTITFTVPMDAPDTLHYNCQYHSSMNAPIYILDRTYSIDDLSDVDTTTAAPTDGQALVWDNSASKWEPATISSGSNYANSDVDTHLNTGTANANEVLSWTGSDYDWVAQSGGGGGASVTTADTAPSSPSDGDLWYDTATLRLYVYYNDGSSSQWVKANPSGSRDPNTSVAIQEAAPSNPSSGDVWFDPNALKTYIYYNDGDSNQWVQANPTGSGIALTNLSVTTNTAGTAALSYSNTTGVFSYTPPDVSYLDITTLGTSEASKAVTADANAKVKLIGTTSVAEMIEKVDIPTSTTGTINFDFLAQAVQLYNTNQTANRTINFRGDSSNSLNSVMATGESMTAAVLMKQGSSAYYLNTYQVDGTGVTPEWSGGSSPSAGNANSIDAYVFTIIKTGDAAFTVLASQSQYA